MQCLFHTVDCVEQTCAAQQCGLDGSRQTTASEPTAVSFFSAFFFLSFFFSFSFSFSFTFVSAADRCRLDNPYPRPIPTAARCCDLLSLLASSSPSHLPSAGRCCRRLCRCCRCHRRRHGCAKEHNGTLTHINGQRCKWRTPPLRSCIRERARSVQCGLCSAAGGSDRRCGPLGGGRCRLPPPFHYQHCSLLGTRTRRSTAKRRDAVASAERSAERSLLCGRLAIRCCSAARCFDRDRGCLWFMPIQQRVIQHRATRRLCKCENVELALCDGLASIGGTSSSAALRCTSPSLAAVHFDALPNAPRMRSER